MQAQISVTRARWTVGDAVREKGPLLEVVSMPCPVVVGSLSAPYDSVTIALRYRYESNPPARGTRPRLPERIEQTPRQEERSCSLGPRLWTQGHPAFFRAQPQRCLPTMGFTRPQREAGMDEILGTPRVAWTIIQVLQYRSVPGWTGGSTPQAVPESPRGEGTTTSAVEGVRFRSRWRSVDA